VYERCQLAYREEVYRDRLTQFVVTAADRWAHPRMWRSLALARARAYHELWPDEEIPDPEVAAIDPSTIEDEARRIRREYEHMREVVSERAPELFDDRPIRVGRIGAVIQPDIWALEDNLRIASGEGYSRSNFVLYLELVKHGVPTSETPSF
jgi:hypothetical protein